mgnify:CR=1 FL=1
MDASNYYCELRTDVLDFNNFPKNLNIPAYIEMNYSCNFPFAVGVLHKDGSLSAYERQPIITLYPTSTDTLDTWNKTYLFISDATNFFTSADEFDQYIAVSNSQGNDDIKIRLKELSICVEEIIFSKSQISFLWKEKNGLDELKEIFDVINSF